MIHIGLVSRNEMLVRMLSQGIHTTAAKQKGNSHRGFFSVDDTQTIVRTVFSSASVEFSLTEKGRTEPSEFDFEFVDHAFYVFHCIRQLDGVEEDYYLVCLLRCLMHYIYIYIYIYMGCPIAGLPRESHYRF